MKSFKKIISEVVPPKDFIAGKSSGELGTLTYQDVLQPHFIADWKHYREEPNEYKLTGENGFEYGDITDAIKDPKILEYFDELINDVPIFITHMPGNRGAVRIVKGRSVVCLNPGNISDEKTLMVVLLHELIHMVDIKKIGHRNLFSLNYMLPKNSNELSDNEYDKEWKKYKSAAPEVRANKIIDYLLTREK